MTKPWDNASPEEIINDIYNFIKMDRDQPRKPFIPFGRGIGSMTPIFCFRVKDLELWTQDFAGNKQLIATCPDEDNHTWLVNCLSVFHNRPVLQWNDPDSKVNR